MCILFIIPIVTFGGEHTSYTASSIPGKSCSLTNHLDQTNTPYMLEHVRGGVTNSATGQG